MSLYTTDMPASYLGRNQCYRRDHFAFVGRASWIVWKEHDRLLLDGLTLICTQSICQEFDHQKKKKKNNNNNNNNNKQPQHVFERSPTSRINWFHLVATGESYGRVGNSKIVIVFIYIYKLIVCTQIVATIRQNTVFPGQTCIYMGTCWQELWSKCCNARLWV